MSKLSAYNNNRVIHQSFDHSLNVEDLIRQNQHLKRSIQQLLQQNSQLTQIINQLYQKQSTTQNVTNINQEQLQALAHQVIQLQNQLDQQKQKPKQQVQDQQLIKAITQLTSQFQTMQDRYQNQLDKLQKQLIQQKGQCQNVLETTESRFNQHIQEYHDLLDKLKKKDQLIKQLQNRLNETKVPSRKQLKISTTIEDLRVTLEKQIEEKQSIIKKYELLTKNLRLKLNQK